MKRFIQSSSLVIFVGILAAATSAPASAQSRDERNHERDNQKSNRTSTVVCESRDGRRHRCEADTTGRITLNRQMTRNSNCVEGRTWGYDKNVIWVDHGCRAEFLIGGNDGMSRNHDHGRDRGQAARTVVCESNGSQRSYCRGDARFGVQLTHQLSRTNCVLNRNWGADQNGVWVSNGCRAEFAFKTQ